MNSKNKFASLYQKTLNSNGIKSSIIPLSIIKFRNTEVRHKRMYGYRKNVRILERFFDNHYKSEQEKSKSELGVFDNINLIAY